MCAWITAFEIVSYNDSEHDVYLHHHRHHYNLCDGIQKPSSDTFMCFYLHFLQLLTPFMPKFTAMVREVEENVFGI